MDWPSVGIPIAVLAVIVSVILSIPANFATKVVQQRWIRGRKKRDERIQWYEELSGLTSRISGSTDLYKQSLVSHDVLIPDDEYIENQLQVSAAKERGNWDEKLDEQLLDELEGIVTSDEAVAKERANYQQSAIEKIEKINQRKMADMAALHDELLRHVADQSISDDDSIKEPLENLLIQTYIQSIFSEITDSNYQEIQKSCDRLKEECEAHIEELS